MTEETETANMTAYASSGLQQVKRLSFKMSLGLTELNHDFPPENLMLLHILKAIYHKVSSSGMHNYFQISLSLDVL